MNYGIMIFVALLIALLAFSRIGKLHIQVDYVGNKAAAAQLKVLER